MPCSDIHFDIYFFFFLLVHVCMLYVSSVSLCNLIIYLAHHYLASYNSLYSAQWRGSFPEELEVRRSSYVEAFYWAPFVGVMFSD